MRLRRHQGCASSNVNTMNLAEKRSEILRIATRHGASNLRVCGSFARGEVHPRSDLDLLVDIAPDRSLLDLVAVAQEFEVLLKRRVDVVTEAGLYHAIRARILAESRPL